MFCVCDALGKVFLGDQVEKFSPHTIEMKRFDPIDGLQIRYAQSGSAAKSFEQVLRYRKKSDKV